MFPLLSVPNVILLLEIVGEPPSTVIFPERVLLAIIGEPPVVSMVPPKEGIMVYFWGAVGYLYVTTAYEFTYGIVAAENCVLDYGARTILFIPAAACLSEIYGFIGVS